MSELRPGRAERTPLFEAVGAALKREIASGRFAETDVLPGERELSEMLDVSRTTLRRAIAALVDEGVLAHRHGAGTFVRRNPPHVEQPLSRLTSFTEDMRLRGLDRIVAGDRAGHIPAHSGRGDDARHRSRRERLSPLAVAARRRRADGDRSRRGSAAIFSNGAHAAEESLYAALESSGFRPVRALQRLRAIIIGPAEAALLEIAAGSAALDIQRIAYLADGRCVEFTRSFYRSDTFDFVAELTLSSTSRQRAEGAAR